MNNVLGYRTTNIRNNYTLGEPLGHGQRGPTVLCTDNDTEIAYACKSILKCNITSTEDVEDIREEIRVMRYLSEFVYNTVSIHDRYEDSEAVHLVVDLCDGGGLYGHVIRMRYEDERCAAKLFGNIVAIIAGCHHFGLVLRDVKLENFMLDTLGDFYSVKAIDFRFAVFGTGRVFTEIVGSPEYLAPEVIQERYGKEADVWSAGIILCIILTGVPPFRGDTMEETIDAVLTGYIDFDSDPWPLLSNSARDLVKNMLCLEPSERLDAYDVLRHDWFHENGVYPEPAVNRTALQERRAFEAAMRGPISPERSPSPS